MSLDQRTKGVGDVGMERGMVHTKKEKEREGSRQREGGVLQRKLKRER